MIPNFFVSKSVRQAKEMVKHARKVFNAQRDILSPQAVSGMESAILDLKNAIAIKSDEETLKKKMDALEEAARKFLKPYPHSAIRENVEVLLVALAVAVGIRTFFLQPFKIPTGSMQPTLFGVTPSPFTPAARNNPDLQIPNRISRFAQYWINGVSYYNEVAPEDGELQRITRPVKFLLFNLKQQYQFNNKTYTIWFPEDDVFRRAGYQVNEFDGEIIDPPHLKAGDPILRLKVLAGDHLFVDRVSYNFRHPARGEIIVFETKGIERMPIQQQGEFYIKRLVALGDEKVQIGNDRHLVINGKRLDEHTPHFENVYSFESKQPPMESHYSGHVNQFVASEYGYRYPLAPLFPDESTAYQTRPNHYMVMGDNTMNSSDSRTWGDFTRTNVIGKYMFVYWPVSERFGFNKVR